MDAINNEGGTRTKGKKMLWLVVLIVLIVLVVLWKTDKLAIGVGSTGSYQAVFLSNNQVYFGKLSSANAQYPILRDIYYLQITQPLQPKDETAPPSPNINLVKLGSEIHGPLDEMRINRDHILFIEDLKADSQVAKAIEDYKKTQGQ